MTNKDMLILKFFSLFFILFDKGYFIYFKQIT